MSQPAARLFGRDFIALLCVQVATGFAFSTFVLLPKFMVEELHASPSQVGWVAAGFGLCSLCAMPLVGQLLDRGHSRPAIILGCCLMAVSAFGFITVTEPVRLPFALRFLQGVCVSLVVNGGSLLVSQIVPAARLTEAIGIFAAANLSMNAIAPLVAELMTQRFGYTPSFALAGASALLAAGLALRVPAAHATSARDSTGFWDMLRQPRYLRMAYVLAIVGMGFGAVFTFVAPFALSMRLPHVRGFFLAFAIAAVLMRLFVLRMLEGIGRRSVARSALLLYGLSVLALVWLDVGTLDLLGAGLGLAHGVFMPVYTALMVQETPSHWRGRMLSLFNASFGLGNAAVLGLGPCVEAFGYRTVFAMAGVAVCVAPLLLEARSADGLAADAV